MKILFDHPFPFALAHGGWQTQIEQTKAALERAGLEVENLRWWDSRQKGDIIHYFGRPTEAYIDLAHGKGIKVVVAELLTGLGSRSTFERVLQKSVMTLAQTFLPKTFLARLAWTAYRKADVLVALTPWEATLMRTMFGADPARIHVITNGVENEFFPDPLVTAPVRGPELVCTAAIHPRKRVVELAEAAGAAKVPVHVIGRPYGANDPYHFRLVEGQNKYPDFVRYTQGISDRAELAEVYRTARGFVLLSTMESLSLSALEAAAAGCPLLLSDLPWARDAFGGGATYVPVSLSPGQLATRLREFYDKAPEMKSAFRPPTWDEVAQDLVKVYRGL